MPAAGERPLVTVDVGSSVGNIAGWEVHLWILSGNHHGKFRFHVRLPESTNMCVWHETMVGVVLGARLKSNRWATWICSRWPSWRATGVDHIVCSLNLGCAQHESCFWWCAGICWDPALGCMMSVDSVCDLNLFLTMQGLLTWDFWEWVVPLFKDMKHRIPRMTVVPSLVYFRLCYLGCTSCDLQEIWRTFQWCTQVNVKVTPMGPIRLHAQQLRALQEWVPRRLWGRFRMLPEARGIMFETPTPILTISHQAIVWLWFIFHDCLGPKRCCPTDLNLPIWCRNPGEA